MIPIRTTILAFALTALAVPALAQTLPPAQSRGLAPPSGGAAATLPNTFDTPGPARAAPLPPPPGAPTAEAQVAEEALRAIIGQIQAGDLDESLFTPTLARRLNGEMAAFTPLVQGFGDLQTIEAQGAQGGQGQFLVIFENAATQWRIGLDDEGLIAALLFRESPAESSDPTPPAPASPGAQ